MIDTHELLKNS